MLHKYKEKNLVFSIEKGFFKKKTVSAKDWHESIVEEKEISYLFNLLSKESCFFFTNNEIFFLENGKYNLLSFTDFSTQNIDFADMHITSSIQEKAKKNKNFLSNLAQKQKEKMMKKLGPALNFAQDFSLGEIQSFNIKEQFIDKNLLTEQEILAAINQP